MLRGEFHIILSELIELSQSAEESCKQVISIEQAEQRTDREERTAVFCCEILDIILGFLVGNDTNDESSSPNNRRWENLPFQSLLDLQKVRFKNKILLSILAIKYYSYITNNLMRIMFRI